MYKGMKLVKQANLHNPEKGIFGDCHRTCMSILLGLERDNVPNFGEHFNDMDAWNLAVTNFLTPLGLREFAVAFTGECDAVLKLMKTLNPGTPFIFSGASRTGVNHSVCADGDGIFWDPSINGSGIVGPCDDGYYWIYVYVKVVNA